MDRSKTTSKVEGRITGLLHRIPGYSGYRDKEDRRDEDKRLRDAIAAEIQEGVQRLTQYNADLSAERELKSVGRIEKLVGQIRLLADRVRTTSYGYGGIFTDREVDAAALDQLRQFDLSLQGEVTSLKEKIGALVSSFPPQDDSVRSLSDDIDRLNTLFSARTDVVDNGKPSRDEKVLALLATVDTAKPSPLLAVSRGDTLSVLGDNFVANATMTIVTDQGPLNLVRVSEDTAGATWLMGSGIKGIISARLTESTSDAPAYQTMHRGSATIDTEHGRQEGVAVQIAARSTAADDLELVLVIGESARVYRGNEISDMDVEIYGAA